MSELHVRNIANDIQKIHGIHLSGEAWDKIRQGVGGAVHRDREELAFERDLYKRLYEEQKEGDYLKQRNELVIRLNREIYLQPQHAEIFSYVLFIMEDIEQKLKDGRSVR